MDSVCSKSVFAMDAIFGLPRKKSAGISCRSPLHGALFFGDQATLDEFVVGNAEKKPIKDVS